MKELVFELIITEIDYKTQKEHNHLRYNELLLDLKWDDINKERVEKGLSKLSNQAMKDAYIETVMLEDYNKEKDIGLKYDKLRRLYDVAMKYSYDILR